MKNIFFLFGKRFQMRCAEVEKNNEMQQLRTTEQIRKNNYYEIVKKPNRNEMCFAFGFKCDCIMFRQKI